MKQRTPDGPPNNGGRRYRSTTAPVRLAEVRTVPMTEEQRKKAVAALAEILLPYLEEMADEEDVAL